MAKAVALRDQIGPHPRSDRTEDRIDAGLEMTPDNACVPTMHPPAISSPCFGKMIRRPVSRVLSPGRAGATVIHLRSCLHTTCCDLPGQHAEAHVQPESCGLSLFGLAPGGACLALFLAVEAVRSYRTVSPLPDPKVRRSVLCCAFPGVTPAGRYPAPCLRGARTFLDNTVSGPVAATAQPPDRRLDRSDRA